ncbi:FkbM family methyltransferase [Sinimarinibacterium thermocellulolyticum]|uniref:FkbM family methyltransferase n=1 Tax=Sinimarinibacterium thermocellulolyticum TaxID=3170016 RepID=A0ABV2A5X9_9GAMM
MLYTLSRFSPLHRMLRKLAYTVLWRLPGPFKEWALHAILGRRLPYRVVEAGDTVIQIGAPWDILKSGRSRFIHFLRRVGPTGRVVVIEPDPTNVHHLREYVAQRGIRNLTIVPKGAWSHPTRLRFLVDPSNPAANLVEDVLDSTRTDLGRFQSSEIEVDTVDRIASDLGLHPVRMVSITSNGSENRILEGMREVQRSAEFIATIGEYRRFPLLAEYGYVPFGGDDRGYTFRKQSFAGGG